jgi:hypothetical protein
MTVFLEWQRVDKSYAVYVGGDDDVEGKYDALCSYDGRNVTQAQAERAARTYANDLARGLRVDVHYVKKERAK